MEKIKKEQKKILSNGGFSSMFTEATTHKLDLELDNGIFKISLVPNSNNPISFLKPDITRNDLDIYLQELYKVADKNKIVDTDKVFFIKNSIYPRSNFNRYSTKARRIENIDKADKIVFQPNPSFWVRSIYDVFYNKESNMIINKGISSWEIRTFIENHGYNLSWLQNPENNVFKKVITELYNESKNSSYSTNSKYQLLLLNLINIGLKKEFTILNSSMLNINNKITESFFELLFENREISKLVTDNSVNRYIDNFKPPLDETNFKILKDALSIGDKNITMGLKLLENMDIKKNLPYFYALFMVSAKNSHNITSNKVWNSVGIKNLRENYDINSIINNYVGSASIFNTLEHIYTKKLEEKKDKELFKSLCKDTIMENLEELLSPRVFNVLKLKID